MGDNTDIIVMNEALKLVRKKLVNVIDELAKFADEYKELPTLAFTFPAGTADYRRKTCNTLDAGIFNGFRGFRVCTE